MTDRTPVSVSRRIPATPRQIFAILADPSRHPDFDGSGMLRDAIDPAPVSKVGDVFAMKMYHHEFGDYEMNNTVVEHRQDRLIAWEPARRDMEAEPWHYRWRYELTPDGDATVVTESFDLSRSPEEAWRATNDGATWIPAMTASPGAPGTPVRAA